MRRALVGGAVLLLGGVISARSKPEPLVFVFLRVDHEQSVAFLRPMIAPDLGAQLVSGAPKIERGTVLRCEPLTHTQAALVDGQLANVTELILDCGDHKFIVKGLDFSGRSTNR